MPTPGESHPNPFPPDISPIQSPAFTWGTSMDLSQTWLAGEPRIWEQTRGRTDGPWERDSWEKPSLSLMQLSSVLLTPFPQSALGSEVFLMFPSAFLFLLFRYRSCAYFITTNYGKWNHHSTGTKQDMFFTPLLSLQDSVCVECSLVSGVWDAASWHPEDEFWQEPSARRVREEAG